MNNLIIIAVIIIFLLCFGLLMLIRQIWFKKKLKVPVVLLMSILLTPIFYMIWIRLALLYTFNYEPKIDFKSSAWKAKSLDRVYMVDDIVTSKLLLNKPADYALSQLGKADFGDSINYLSYVVGRKVIGFESSVVSLEVTIENDTVVAVKHFSEKMD